MNKSLPSDKNISKKKTKNYEKVEKYVDKKRQSKEISEAYKLISWHEKNNEEKKRYKGYRYLINNCGTSLSFKECRDGHERKLVHADFCKIRFCPMCSWRRALKISKEVHDTCYLLLQDNPNLKFLHLILTVPNLSSEELISGVTDFLYSFKKFVRIIPVSETILGYFKTLEVTYNIEKDTYHPHFHCILVVSSSYFKGQSYIRHSKWLDYWKQATKNEDIKNLWIKPIDKSKQNLSKASAEVAKYITKFDTLIQEDSKNTASVLKTLDKSLRSRRIKCFGGIMLDYLKKLNSLSTEEKIKLGLLEHDSNKCSVCGSGLVNVVYDWISDNYLKFEGKLELKKKRGRRFKKEDFV
jgi:plasmid rolling circle replication initiator protein Rep